MNSELDPNGPCQNLAILGFEPSASKHSLLGKT